MKIKERALALFISLVMVLTLMPALAFADDTWSAEAINPVPVIGVNGAELEVRINTPGYAGFTFKWYRLPDSGPGEETPLPVEDEYQMKITVNEPGNYKCAVTDIDNRTVPVFFEVAYQPIEGSWTNYIKSITASFASDGEMPRFEFLEEIDKTSIWRWNDESEDGVEIDGYAYGFSDGDTITATLIDGTTKTVVAKEEESDDYYVIRWFVQEDNEYLSDDDYEPFFDDNQLNSPWVPNGDNYYWVTFGGYNDENGNFVEVTTDKNANKATIVPTDDLERARAAALNELSELMQKYDSCRPAQQQELSNIYRQALDVIINAETVDVINVELTAAKLAIGAVKTDAQLKAEEAAAASAAAAAAAESARQGTFDGTVPKVKTSAPKVAKKSATIKWKKLNKKQLKKGVTNIEVWVCPNTGFGPNDTIIKTTGKKKASVKVKGLAKGTYFVKVRAIKNVGGVKYVGPWSGTKKVKIKK